ncbi:hypothetical protein B0H21DRAFT_699359, partial [Amylocystis lapponica]
LRNFSIDSGLVKSVRVLFLDVGNHLIAMRILRGRGGVPVVGKECTDPAHPAFDGFDLTRTMFSRGQLYIALSRISHCSHARVYLRPGENTTTNVTYHENFLA